ncbi:hypothetical protein GN109_25605 [Collimonas pratensis]|uniref:hypothetical protein n=1 Tax=Collimonas pratensis TaxID=279113 RepID=UPI00143DA0FA|nr:hypothetical protein [Collimonas pratensis]NKI72797.1 hypothetical protein [Collimonas pratensis]
MKVSEVLRLKTVSQDGEVTIEGTFVMEHGIGYFVQSKEDMGEKSRAIMVNYPELERLLLSSVPAYAGSKYSYCNDAVITGVIKVSPQAVFPFAIGDIHNFSVRIYEESLMVLG